MPNIIDTPPIRGRWQPATVDLTHQEHDMPHHITTPTTTEAWADALEVDLPDHVLATLDDPDGQDDVNLAHLDLAYGMPQHAAVSDHDHGGPSGYDQATRQLARLRDDILSGRNNNDDIPRDRYGDPTYEPSARQAARDKKTADRIAAAWVKQFDHVR